MPPTAASTASTVSTASGEPVVYQPSSSPSHAGTPDPAWDVFADTIGGVCRDYATGRDVQAVFDGPYLGGFMRYLPSASNPGVRPPHPRRTLVGEALAAAFSGSDPLVFTFDDTSGVGVVSAAGEVVWRVLLPGGAQARLAEACLTNGTVEHKLEDLEDILTLSAAQAGVVLAAFEKSAWLYQRLSPTPLSEEDLADIETYSADPGMFAETDSWDQVAELPWRVLRRYLGALGVWDLPDSELRTLASLIRGRRWPKIEELVALAVAAHA